MLSRFLLSIVVTVLLIFFVSCSCNSDNNISDITISKESNTEKGRTSKGTFVIEKGEKRKTIESGSYGEVGNIELVTMNKKTRVLDINYSLNIGVGAFVYSVYSTEDLNFGERIAEKVIFDYYEKEVKIDDQYIHYSF